MQEHCGVGREMRLLVLLVLVLLVLVLLVLLVHSLKLKRTTSMISGACSVCPNPTAI